MAKRLHTRIQFPGDARTAEAGRYVSHLGASYLMHCASRAVLDYWESYKYLHLHEDKAIRQRRFEALQTELTNWLEKLDELANELDELAEEHRVELGE